jgi:hypothetical protein
MNIKRMNIYADASVERIGMKMSVWGWFSRKCWFSCPNQVAGSLKVFLEGSGVLNH